MNTYLIKYDIILRNTTLKGKIIRVKNQENELFAKINLEKYLKRKYNDEFLNLYIESVTNDFDFMNIFNMFINGKV